MRSYICELCFQRGTRTELLYQASTYQGIAEKNDWFLSTRGPVQVGDTPAATVVAGFFHCPECNWRSGQ